MPRLRSLALVGAAALALTVPACTPETETEGSADLQVEVDQLRTELQERREADTALEQQLADLEVAVADATDDDLAERLDAVDEELARLVEGLTVLEADLGAESSARAQLAEGIEATDRDLRNGLAELRNGLAELRDGLDGVRGSVGLLDDQVEVLRERVDRATG